MASKPPPVGSTLFITDGMDSLRSKVIKPRFGTAAPRSIQGRTELLRGAELLRLHGPRAVRGATIEGHQVLVADILGVPHDVLALLEPRRSFKTSTLFSLAMGRIASREDYMVSYTMTTTATKARQRFRDDIVKPLEQVYPDPKTRPFKIVKAGGSERIEWTDTGSVFAFLAPKGDSFRSDAWDWIILDEAGQADVEMGEDIMDGAAATLVTRAPDSHLTITGTAPKFRTGNLLWDALEKGRNGEAGYSILEFAIDQDTALSDVDTWEKVEPILPTMHPAVDHPTPLSAIRPAFNLMGAESFMREYLGVAGHVGQSTFINVPHWNTMADTGALPTPPARFRLAYTVHLTGRTASVVAAWRDEDGKAVGLVLAHEDGSAWVARKLRELAVKYRVPVAFDKSRSVDQVVSETLSRDRSARVKLEGAGWPEVSSAAAGLLSEIESGNVKHYAQADLDAAVLAAIKRGTTASKRWTFGVTDEDTEDATALSAFALALRAYDEQRPASKIEMITGV